MKTAFRAHRAHFSISIIVIATAISALMADKVVPLDMRPALLPRPWPAVEIVTVLAYSSLFQLATSRVSPFDTRAPRSRTIRFWEAVMPLVAALGIGLFGAWRLQVSQAAPVQWQTILVNVVIVAGAMMCLAVFLRTETAIAMTLLAYFSVVLAQTGLDPKVAGMLPLARITGPGPWFGPGMVLFAAALAAAGVLLRTYHAPTPMQSSDRD